MRNLHHDKIYYNSLVLLETLAEFNITVSPEQDKRALRRFIMGELMVPINNLTRRDVKRSLDIRSTFTASGDIDTFFCKAQEALMVSLKEEIADLSVCKDITIEPYATDGLCMFEVCYLSPETDSEIASRQRHADIFNSILLNKNEIYKRLDERLISG